MWLLFLPLLPAQLSIKGYKSIKSPSDIVLSNDNQFMYLLHYLSIGVYKIDPKTKQPQSIQQLSLDAVDLKLSPDGRFAWVVMRNRIQSYRVDPNKGTLTLAQTYENTIGQASIADCDNWVISPSGRFVLFSEDKTLYLLRMNEGRLSYWRQYPLSQQNFGGIAFSPDERWVYINGFESNCELAVVAFDANSGNLQVAQCLERHVDIPGHYYQSLSGRTLHYARPEFDNLTLSPDGKDVYLQGSETIDDNAVMLHYRWQNGQLNLVKTYRNLYKPLADSKSIRSLHLDGSGHFMYAFTGSRESGVYTYRRDPNSGALSFVTSFERVKGYARVLRPYKIAFSSDNRHVYIANFFGGNVMILENNAATASPKPLLSPQPTITTANPPVPTNPTNNPSPATSPASSSPVLACTGNAMDRAALQQLEQQLLSMSSEEARYDYALKELQNHCLEVIQVLRIAKVFEVEYRRLKFVEFMYYYLTDTADYPLLEVLFSNDRLKAAFLASIK